MITLCCFGETDNGLERLEIQVSGDPAFDGVELSVWVNGDFDDSIFDVKDLERVYGTKLYGSKQDFKKGDSVTIHDLWLLRPEVKVAL